MTFSPTPNMIAEKVGPVGKLIFNKPQKHNATSTDMWEAIPVILDEFEKDPAIRVVVVTGAGDKAFVSGADISEFEKARNTPEQVAYYDKIGEVAKQAGFIFDDQNSHAATWRSCRPCITTGPARHAL